MKSPFTDAHIVKWGALPTEYAAEPAERGTPQFTMRAHAVAEFRRNPRRWKLGYQSPESKSKDYGDMLDCLALTPWQWPERFAVVPADAPRRPSKAQLNAKKPSPETLAAIQWWKEFADSNPGEVISADTNAAVHAALQRLKGEESISQFLSNCKAQCWIEAQYHDSATGLVVPVKCLIDIVPNAEQPIFGQCLGDLKSTRNAAPHSFRRDCFQYGYHIAAAWYQDLFLAATGEDRSDFVHIVQENYPPYEPRMPILSARFVNLGRISYQAALVKYCKCVCSGVWPSYDPPGDFPITEVEPWMEDMSQIFDPIEEPEEEESAPTEEADLIP